jgi:hypothetical protein
MRTRAGVLTLALVVALTSPASALSKKNVQLFRQLAAYVASSSYGADSTTSVDPQFCTCVQVGCRGQDFRVNCSGGFLPFPGVGGLLTAVGTQPNTFNVCGACGCNGGTSPMTLAVAVVCVPPP